MGVPKRVLSGGDVSDWIKAPWQNVTYVKAIEPMRKPAAVPWVSFVAI